MTAQVVEGHGRAVRDAGDDDLRVPEVEADVVEIISGGVRTIRAKVARCCKSRATRGNDIKRIDGAKRVRLGGEQVAFERMRLTGSALIDHHDVAIVIGNESGNAA